MGIFISGSFSFFLSSPSPTLDVSIHFIHLTRGGVEDLGEIGLLVDFFSISWFLFGVSLDNRATP